MKIRFLQTEKIHTFVVFSQKHWNIPDSYWGPLQYPMKYLGSVICFNNQERGWEQICQVFSQCMGTCGKQGDPWCCGEIRESGL